ncbi:MAG: hypothetical protein AABY05_03465, partial [Nanoarchaeota archaeon]
RELFGIIGIERLFFSFMILFGMLVSYYFISALIKRFPKSLIAKLDDAAELRGIKPNLLIKGKKRMLFALIFFFNPFVYTRLMIGQLGILIAYFLMPMFLYYLFKMFEEDMDYKSVLKVAVSISLIGQTTAHFFVLCFLMFFLGIFWFYQKEKGNARYLKILGVFLLLIFLLNLHWIQGLFSGGILGEINEDHEDFFSPKQSLGVSAFAKVIGMWGFWREAAYESSYKLMPLGLWYFLLALLFSLLLMGYYSDNKDKKSKFFYSLFWIGLILGVGISHPYTGKIFRILFENVPLFNGFRDSHKFVAFIALAYAYFIPIAVEKINEKLIRKRGKIFALVFTILVVLLVIGSSFVLIGLHGQVKNTEYPESYFALNEFLNGLDLQGKLIYLPWESYLSYNWTREASSDGRIAVFANEFMDKEVIEGPDEYGGNNDFRREVSGCLEIKNKSCLKEIGVEYVLEDKCAVYSERYDWFEGERKFESECVDVYYIGGVAEKKEIPGRFLISLFVSVSAFVYSIFVILRRGF